ncbi:MAG: hypothetical protein NTV06_04885, partial [candidate division Zixibacteria bacterium]|nr:hypothetical protein [candidate division Zixibacteria bacterium]
MKSAEKTKEGTNSPNAIKLKRQVTYDSVWSAVNDKSSNRLAKMSRNIKRWDEGSVAVYSQDLISALGRYANLTEKFIQTFAGQNAVFDVIASSFLQAGDNVFIAGPTGDNFKVAAESCGAVVKYHYGVSP